MKKNKLISGITILFTLFLCTDIYGQPAPEVQATIKASSSDNNCVEIYVMPDHDFDFELRYITFSVSIPDQAPDNPTLQLSTPLGPAMYILLIEAPSGTNNPYHRNGRYQYDIKIDEFIPTDNSHLVMAANTEHLIATVCFENGPPGINELVQLNTLKPNEGQDFGGPGFTEFGISVFGGGNDADKTNATEPYYSTTGGQVENGGADLIDDASVETTAPVFLPIELLSFDAQCADGHIELSWATATEVKNDYFSVERSIDGHDWNSIATIPGAGNSYIKHEYRYTDKLNGILSSSDAFYYRLKQTDITGIEDYSGIVLVNCHSEEPTLFEVYPNPSYGAFKIYGNKGENYRIYNSIGKLITRGTLDSQFGSAEINLPDATSGVYFIHVMNKTVKLILQ